MERVNVSRYTLLVLIIAVIFFVIPFFWLQPGEMDLGGDSSRLYFYDPIRYLSAQSLFSVSQSAFGGENLSFFGIPFFLFLFFLKSILNSPTTLISAFHGFSLSLAFIFCYLIVKEILFREYQGKFTKSIVEAAGILAGLYYNLGPFQIGGWGYVILTYNQVFLNPLMFFLLLRFFLTRNIRYLLLALLTTFVFSPNFGFIGAPSFFSFYPLALLFLFIYTKYIRKASLPVKKLILGVALFLLIHAFHLLPQIISLLFPGSLIREAVFSKEGKIGRGLGYFLGVAPEIKVSLSLLHQPQLAKLSWFSWIFTIFPTIMIAGFIRNKRKVYLLTGVIFLIALFFFSANITNIGFKIYASLFHIPGFSMFRTSYGQWQWTYLFFYTLLFGQALFIVAIKITKWQRRILIGFLVTILVTTSWPFIKGTLAETTLWQSKDISSIVKMDPEYGKVLSYIRLLPVDGKILSFPLDNHGYQVLKGQNDAAYLGPSTITYLTNKSEFKGFDEFGVFGPTFLDFAKDENYEAIKNMLAMFNIKYIFYNSDPYIYGDNFPAFPYQYVSQFLPSSQEGYQQFIEDLGVKKIKTFAGKYHVYEVDNTGNTTYLSHLYVAKRIAYWDDYLVDLHTPLSFYPQDKRIAFLDDVKIFNRQKEIFDDIFLKVENKGPFLDFFEQREESKIPPAYIRRKLSFPLYPLVVIREKNSLDQFKDIDMYFDRSLFYAGKRIGELEKFKNEIPILGKVENIEALSSLWKEPPLWQFNRYAEYNCWEISMVRYKRFIEDLIKRLDSSDDSKYSQIINKVDLKKKLLSDKDKIKSIVKESKALTFENKQYLIKLSNEMLENIFKQLNLVIPDPKNINYFAQNVDVEGNYEVYVEKKEIKEIDLSDLSLTIKDNILFPKENADNEWVSFGDVFLDKGESVDILLNINHYPNLTDASFWEMPSKYNLEKDPIKFEVDASLSNNDGIKREISSWDKNSLYLITFDYQTDNKKFKIILNEKKKGKNESNDKIFEDLLQAGSWENYSGMVQSSQGGAEALLQIISEPDDIYEAFEQRSKKKEIEIRNLSVVKVPNPQIILKNVVKPKQKSLPQITFTKINPTKYKVVVKNAQDSYNLVLLEKFNSRWKLFSLNGANEAKTLKGLISRIVGKIITALLRAKNILIASDASQEDWTSHFNNNVIEGMHKNIFLDKDTFETFGYDPIAEATHLPVNRYANGWYIAPEDVQNNQDYELIIEMTSQKLFYVSLLISSVGLFLLIILFLKSLTSIRE